MTGLLQRHNKSTAIMWQERWSELLRSEIRDLIVLVSDNPSLRDLVKEPLRQTGRGLAPCDKTGRSLLSMTVCEAVCGDPERALPVAAARQFLVAAADVFDDIEDADSPNSLSAKHGFPIAVNVATTLLILAGKAVPRLSLRGAEDSLIILTSDVLNAYYLTACAGQHLDLTFTLETSDLEDAYFRVASMKSASQTQCACHIGALVARASQELIDKFSAFGHNLGMASQVANDIQGIIDGSDLIRPKMTLPVVYALGQADGKIRSQLQDIFSRRNTFPPDFVQIREGLFRCGAIHYATVRMEFFRQQARIILSEVARVGVNVERLKLLLE